MGSIFAPMPCGVDGLWAFAGVALTSVAASVAPPGPTAPAAGEAVCPGVAVSGEHAVSEHTAASIHPPLHHLTCRRLIIPPTIPARLRGQGFRGCWMLRRRKGRGACGPGNPAPPGFLPFGVAAISKRHTTASAIIASWRQLTGGRAVRDCDRRTLLACSAGADSSALVLALSAVRAPHVVAHVVHDLRPESEAHADRDAAQALAASLGLPFVEAAVRVRGRPGNAEAVARRERYAALARLATDHACEFVATAHHADDQLETVLMRLTRGAGPSGLAGVLSRRRLSGGVVLVRPCLGVTRAQCEALCRDAGWRWASDATNANETRTRSALRAQVIPALRRVCPDAALKATRAAALVAQSALPTLRAATALWRQGMRSGAARSWPRQALRDHDPALLAEWLRVVVRQLRGRDARGASGGGGGGVGGRGANDRLSAAAIARVVTMLRTRSGEPKRVSVAGVRIEASRDRVTVSSADPA